MTSSLVIATSSQERLHSDDVKIRTEKVEKRSKGKNTSDPFLLLDDVIFRLDDVARPSYLFLDRAELRGLARDQVVAWSPCGFSPTFESNRSSNLKRRYAVTKSGKSYICKFLTSVLIRI